MRCVRLLRARVPPAPAWYPVSRPVCACCQLCVGIGLLCHARCTLLTLLRFPRRRPQLIKPTHALLSPSADLHFDDIPGGIAAIGAVPAAGWFQIIALVGVHELTIAKQDYTKAPGEIPTFLGFKPEDPAEFREKQFKELKNGRLAMIAVLGELMAQQVSGMGTYEQLGAIVDSLPIPL